jgi:hypothetical protein
MLLQCNGMLEYRIIILMWWYKITQKNTLLGDYI